MKKALLPLTLALVLAPAAMAQSAFRVSYCPSSEMKNYIPVENDGVIEVDNIEAPDAPYEYEIPCYLKIENLSGSELPLSFTMEALPDESTLDIADGVSFCYPGLCAPSLPFSATDVIPAGTAWEGAAFHCNYIIGGPNNFDPVDLDTCVGSWLGTFTVETASETYQCTIVLTNNGSHSLGLVNADQHTPVYYNLQGVRIDRPAKGSIYIEHRGSSARKVMM